MVRVPLPSDPALSDPAEAVAAALTWIRAATGAWLQADTPPPAIAPPSNTEPAKSTSAHGAGGQVPGGQVPGGVGAGTQATAAKQAPASTGAWAPPQRSAPTPAPVGDPAQALATMAAEAATCERCTLCAERTHVVYGVGSATPKLVIVGEAPGAEEDRRGEPFVGRAGQLLDKMLAAIGLDRSTVYICNVLKCRPPDNRDPRPDEVGACKSWLDTQLAALQPPLILALGTPAARALLGTRRGITSLRGRMARSVQGHRVMPSFHPAYLLRNPAAKRDAWADLQKVATELELPLPPR